jgi:outer membrane protein assembly factor BamB
VRLVSLFLAILLAAAVGEAAPLWPGFLGAGASPAPADSVPLAWSPTENIAWKAALPGHGQSSPVIHGDDVFVTAVEGPLKDTYHVLCLSLADGTERWRHSLPSTAPVKNSLYVSRAAPTPAVDADRIYAFFESGDLVAVNRDGSVAWSRSLSQDYGPFKNEFGLAASVAQTVDRVFLLIDHEGPSYVVAIAKADGRTLWKQDRTSRVSWTSPAIVTIDGVEQLVCSSAGSVDGYDTATGDRLWSLGDLGGNTAVTPIPFGGGRFLVGASPGREGQNALGARQSNLAMTAKRVAGRWEPDVLWRAEKAMPSFGSPIVYGAEAYWVNRAGAVTCLDVANGQVHYEQRSPESVWATPLGVGERIYLFGKNGTTTVIAVGPAWRVLATNRLWDPDEAEVDPDIGSNEDTEEKRRGAAMFAGRVQYGVATVPGSLLVRTGDVLYCVREAD